ncbi:MAG TPA: hypothetical protein VN436_15640, partial [Holophaga sp.]|nr:hypothetical protein [Holophaga sp.]
ELSSIRVSVQAVPRAFAAPAVQRLIQKLPLPRAYRNLEAVLSLPIAIEGENFQKLPRALNMRYTVQLVKATGENIRNLDVLGVFPVPRKGVAALRHDARTGRLLVRLGPEAVGAPVGRFILAQKKSDHGFVSCFVEE